MGNTEQHIGCIWEGDEGECHVENSPVNSNLVDLRPGAEIWLNSCLITLYFFIVGKLLSVVVIAQVCVCIYFLLLLLLLLIILFYFILSFFLFEI